VLLIFYLKKIASPLHCPMLTKVVLLLGSDATISNTILYHRRCDFKKLQLKFNDY